MDRGYAKFTLFNAIADIKSSYACRFRDNARCNVVESRDLTEEDVEAGVLSDEIVEAGWFSAKHLPPSLPDGISISRTLINTFLQDHS